MAKYKLFFDKFSSLAYYAAIVLIVLYLVGIVGFLSPFQSFFIALTPLQLLISLFALFMFHRGQWTFFIIAFSIGFLAELIGVNTGYIFGEYIYGNVLGWKLFGTPLLIGVNWILVAYGACAIIDVFEIKNIPVVLKAFLASLLMLFLDWWIEPVAIKTGMWNWVGGDIPLENYIGWLMIGYIIAISYFMFSPKQKNYIAMLVFVLQLLFFSVLNLFI